MDSKRFIFFIGTTAELIKLAPVIRELKKRKADFKIITSNQNEVDFTEVKHIIGKQSVYYAFRLKPIKSPKNIILGFLFWSIRSFINYFLYFKHELKNIDKKNIIFIVHGDTVTALLGSIIAKIYRVKLVHIESGLRSFSFLEPFPEEICRFIISQIADIHFCPNLWSLNNFQHTSGIKINTKNNTLIETLSYSLKNRSNFLVKKGIFNRKFFLLILHRQEHILFKKKLTKRYLDILTQYASKNLSCVLILHHLTEQFFRNENLLSKIKKNRNIILMPRLAYLDFIQLLKEAEFIATDGGSNQEEAYYLGKPCIILRNVTERIEGLDRNAILSKGEEKTIVDFLKRYKKFKRNRAKFVLPPSKIIVDYLVKYYQTKHAKFSD